MVDAAVDVTERVDGDEQGDTLERLVGITDGVELKKKKVYTQPHQILPNKALRRSTRRPVTTRILTSRGVSFLKVCHASRNQPHGILMFKDCPL
jgi:hypothetical protein